MQHGDDPHDILHAIRVIASRRDLTFAARVILTWQAFEPDASASEIAATLGTSRRSVAAARSAYRAGVPAIVRGTPEAPPRKRGQRQGAAVK